MSRPDRIGEGDHEADRRYRERTREFLEDESVEERAREAEPEDGSVARELERAERAGRAPAKEMDPSVDRDYSREGSH